MKTGPEKEVFQVLAAAEEALHVTEIARRAKRSRPTVYEAIRALKAQGLVRRSDKLGPMPRYAVNPEHDAVQRLRGDAAKAATPAAAERKLLVVEIEEEKAKVALRTDPERGVGLEVWVTTLEEARALGKLQKAIERLGLEEVVDRVVNG